MIYHVNLFYLYGKGWVNLIDGGVNYILEDFQFATEVLVRSIDLIGASQKVSSLQDNPYKVLSRSKALVWQVGVVNDSGNGGTILVSGLNVFKNVFTASGKHPVVVPEAAWLLHSFLEYAYSAPQSSAKMKLRRTDCPGCIPSVNYNLCPLA